MADNADSLSILQQLSRYYRQSLALPADLSQLNITGAAIITLSAITLLSLGMLAHTARQALNTPPQQMNQLAPSATTPLLLTQLRSKRLFNGSANVQAPVTTTPPISTSSWQLQGVFTGEEKTRGSAILSAQDQPARLLHTQQTLSDGSKLVEVHHDHVLLQQPGGQLQMVRFPTLTTTTLASAASRSASHQFAASPDAQGKPDSAEQRRQMVRKRLETLRQRARNNKT